MLINQSFTVICFYFACNNFFRILHKDCEREFIFMRNDVRHIRIS